MIAFVGMLICYMIGTIAKRENLDYRFTQNFVSILNKFMCVLYCLQPTTSSPFVSEKPAEESYPVQETAPCTTTSEERTEV